MIIPSDAVALPRLCPAAPNHVDSSSFRPYLFSAPNFIFCFPAVFLVRPELRLSLSALTSSPHNLMQDSHTTMWILEYPGVLAIPFYVLAFFITLVGVYFTYLDVRSATKWGKKRRATARAARTKSQDEPQGELDFLLDEGGSSTAV